ncbi:hypothetical protein ASD12_31130 [Mesorhizobium sp. Root102]|uniref:branched-chain amino acid ABC transporter permease n=1 Tax=Mesorhizobium sp. Root102 TaxID=1736422 RepID=UPI0006F79D6E|nr:branched-chain amino acid ABC transporter permease [Mesorhizobium sp. Root102]KQU85863.1 hypothetical protein ASD12_31130 [Mesorhizobium sp. Root102]
MELIQQTVNALSIGAIYALIALGYTMVYGVLKLLNFAHGEMFMLGAFFSYWLIAQVVGSSETLSFLQFVGIGLSILFSCLLVGLVAMLLERIVYRPLRGKPRLSPLLGALGMSIVLQNVVQISVGPGIFAYPTLFGSTRIEIGGIGINRTAIVIIGLSVALMAALQVFLQRSRTGVRIRALAEDHEIARLIGIEINKPIAAIFFIGGALGALGGVLYAANYGVMQFSMGTIVGLKAFTAAVLGGIGSVPGAVLGGFLLGLLETFAAGLLPKLTGGLIGTEYRDVVAFAVLIVVLIFRPSGLLGRPEGTGEASDKKDF